MAGNGRWALVLLRGLALAATVLVAGCNGGSGSRSDSGASAEPESATSQEIVARDYDYEIHDTLIEVVDGPQNDHAVSLDLSVYLPENATPEAPQPVIIVAHGFGNHKLSNEIVSSADYFARHGYIVLTYSAQGFGKSSGCIRLDSFDYDVKNVIALMDQVLEDPSFRINGVALASHVKKDARGALVGMIGGSYGGGVAFNVAAVDARVRAIVPGRTWNSLQYALLPNNLVVKDARHELEHQVDRQGVFKAQWTSLLFAQGNSQPLQGNGGCPQEKIASGDPLDVAGLACTGFPSDFCQVYAGIAATGDASPEAIALVRNSSIASKIDRLRAPTLLVQGLPDTIFNINDASANYFALKQAGVPVAMIWNSAAHGAYFTAPGECEVYGGTLERIPDGCYLPDRALRWFEHWLHGDTTIDTGPEFAWYRKWLPYDESGTAASQYGHADAFPAQKSRRFYLSGADQLVADESTLVAGSASFINPPGGVPVSYSETSNFSSPAGSPELSSVPPGDPPGQAISFTSMPFDRAVESVGIPRAHLNISHSNGQDMVFFAKVFDVAPDGSAELIHRLAAPVRVPDDELASAIDIRLLGFVHRFEAGHSVRLTLASTDATSYNAKVADVITVVSGGLDPSWVEFPLD